MKTQLSLVGILYLIVFFEPLIAGPPIGLIRSSQDIITYLKQIETKLQDDQAALNSGFGDLIGGAQTAVDNTSDFRKQMELQRILLGLHNVWDDKRFRRPVLYSMATVNLAVDDIGATQMADIRQMETNRQNAMQKLIGLVQALRRNQEKLIAYLADESASKRLGELNIDLIAQSVTEAKALRHTIDGEVGEEVNIDEERKNLQNAVDNLQRLLEFIDR